jgi:hypothetical protein
MIPNLISQLKWAIQLLRQTWSQFNSLRPFNNISNLRQFSRFSRSRHCSRNSLCNLSKPSSRNSLCSLCSPCSPSNLLPWISDEVAICPPTMILSSTAKLTKFLTMLTQLTV